MAEIENRVLARIMAMDPVESQEIERNSVLDEIMARPSKSSTTYEEKPLEERTSELFPNNQKRLHRNSNLEELVAVTCKIEKDSSKLFKKVPTIKEVSSNEAYSNFQNDYSYENLKSERRATTLWAVGLGLALVGGLIISPSIIEKTPPENSVEFFETMSNLGVSVAKVGIIPAVGGLIETLRMMGIEIKILRVDRLFKKKKTLENQKVELESVKRLIDDYESDLEDPSMDFARKFMRNVKLSHNPDVDYIILKGIAKHRDVCALKQAGKAADEDVSFAWGYMISCFEEARRNKECPPSFKDDERVSSLIEQYHRDLEREEENIAQQRVA